jgi:chromosome segregation ATPase
MNGSTDRATWVHPRVAINIAQWISPKFDVKVSAWVHELLVCGNVRYGNERGDYTVMYTQLEQLRTEIVEKNKNIDDITQQRNEIKQQHDSIEQQRNEIKQQHNIVTQQNNELKAMMVRFGINMDGLMQENKGLHTELTSVNTELKIVHTELTSTKDLVVNIAERCVPVTSNNAIKEVYALFHVRNNHYYSMRVQQRSLHSSIKRYEKNNNVALKPVKEWICSPNAILLHHYIKEELSIKRNTLKIDGNDMYLSAECKIESLVRKIDRLHAIRY